MTDIKALNEITGEIVDASIAIHKELGPGLLEKIYEDALCYELEQRKLKFERQKELKVPYKTITLPTKFRLDLIVENEVIIELKQCEKLLPIHEAQILTYLKITNRRIGLLLNFNETLMKHGIRRIIL